MNLKNQYSGNQVNQLHQDLAKGISSDSHKDSPQDLILSNLRVVLLKVSFRVLNNQMALVNLPKEDLVEDLQFRSVTQSKVVANKKAKTEATVAE